LVSRLALVAASLIGCGPVEESARPNDAGGAGGLPSSGAGGGGTRTTGGGSGTSNDGGAIAGAGAAGSAGIATTGGAPTGGTSSGGASGQAGGAGSSAAGTAGRPTCGGIPERDPEAFVHPGGLHKKSDLERMRYQVEALVEPWAESFERLRADSRASPTYAVRGDPSWTSVERGGTHGAEFESDANAAYLNALMWAVTGDERHAQKCVEIFDTWKNLTLFVPGGTGPLNAGLFAYKLVEAAEIIASTYDGWPEADRAAFAAMLVYPGYAQQAVPAEVSDTNGTFYWRIVNGDPGRHGNQDLIAWRAMLVMGVFLDNRVMFDRALRYFKGEPHREDDLPYASGPSPSGAQTADNEYFTTFQYSPQTTTPDYGYNGVLEHYVWENGQCQETSRDQQHALFGLGIAAGIAELAWNQGDGVWNALDHRLLKGFEFTARYNASAIATFPDQATPWEPAGDELIVRTDRTGRWRSKTANPHFETDFVEVSRGDFPGKRPVFEQPLAHFQVRMGRPAGETLWTERARDVAIAESGPETIGFSLDHPGFGGLTFRRPPLCAGDPITGFVDGLPVFGVPVLPATLKAVNYDHFPVSGEGHTYHDASPGNAGMEYRADDVDIACGPEGAPVVSDFEPGEWLTYTIYVPTGGSFRIEARYLAAEERTLSISFGGVDLTGEVALPATNGILATETLASGLTLEAGVQAARVVAAGSDGELLLDSVTIAPE
jgi:hypothetical protein